MARRAQVVLGLAVLVAFALASSSPSQGAPGAQPPDFDKAVAALEKHGDNWLDKRGVVGVGIGVNKAGKAVIHVYKVKDDDEGIPSDVDGVAVAQVRTGRFDPRAAPTDRWPRPVPIGVSSGLADFATGTVAARVTDGTKVYALSNNHVFAGVNTASIGDPITQPGPDDGGSDPGDRIATLADYQEIDFNGGDNTMDAAIALTSAGDVGTATPPDGYGAPSTTPAAASIGMGLQKYGRTTGLQLGTVEDISLMVDVCYFAFGEFCFPGYEARFVNQISVSPATFSAPGDSGSLMVTQGGNHPVALLFAGDGNLTIGNPIIPVLQRFDVTIEGGPPVDGPPAAPTTLSASAGDDLVELNWNVPSFNGGSPITHYRVFRGASPGDESFLALSTSTTYTDATAENGTTYHYKVSAVNDIGEGPLSNGANATPAALIAPSAPLAIIDGFNRANENPLSDQARWSNSVIGTIENGHHVTANQLACSVTTTCTAWRNNAQFGPDVEVYARLSTLPGVTNQLRLYARLQMPGATGGYLLRTNQLSGTDEVWLERFSGSATRLLTIAQELAAGDILLLRAQGATIEAWRHDGSTWSRLGTVQDATFGAAGYTGVGLRGTTGRVDDFGARGLGLASAPGAPIGLSATAADAQVALTWSAPAFDGGSTVTGYNLYRGTSPGGETLLPTPAITSTSYLDTSAANGTTYHYKVSAVNDIGEGPLSNGANATPAALIAPSAPLAIIDGFNRANENPLSDQARWSNSVIGTIENGHHVTANQLACSVTTTCTAWRNNAQFGPDVEVYARLSTLPGVTNQLRLYARLQMPGATGGYLLRTNQLSGTDEVWLERFSGSATRLLTIAQELAAGDILLLRAQGATIEAWRHDGSTWSRLGTVQDATFGAAGYTGVGLRGTTGRVDDFGARTLGGPAPDTDPPSPPGTLAASAFSSTRIDLSWGQASDNVGVTRYRIERCEGASCANFAEIATVTAPATSYQNTGLTPSTSYSYRVRAEDAAPNLGQFSNVATQNTPAPPDTEAPSAPGTPNLTPVSPTQIDLTWAAASDNVGVTLYRIERCSGAGCSVFSEVGTSASTSFSNTGLTASTSYTYRVRAQDAALNLGPLSATATASTPAPPDTEAPSAPGTPNLTPVSPTQIDLTWAAASDNVGVTLYRIERCSGAGCSVFSEVGTSASTSFSNTGLTASTSYTYRVRAQDAALNLGPLSATATTSTPNGVLAPLEPLPVVDSFNRRNENPLANGWSNGIGGSVETGLRVNSNTVQCTKTTTCTAWRTNPALGPDTEVWARVSTLPGTGNQLRLYARLQNAGLSAHSGYVLRTNQLAGTDQVLLERIDAGAVVTRLTIPRELAAGDTILLRVKGATLEAWLKRGSTWSLLGSVADSTYAAAGRVGVGIRGKTGRLDDFGAR